jgi:hypothetical protein
LETTLWKGILVADLLMVKYHANDSSEEEEKINWFLQRFMLPLQPLEYGSDTENIFEEEIPFQ